MSRRASALVLLTVFFAFAPDVRAQPRITAEEAVENAQEAYGPPTARKACPTVQAGEEIVVCAEEQEQDQFRLRTDSQAEDDYARATMDKGAPRAPDVAGPGIFKGPATIGGMCLPGIGNCPAPPAYIIDFTTLPETPPGSDADRVGKGLAPLGDDGNRPQGPAGNAPVSSPESASPAVPQ